ncbi:hypothetical protein ACK3C2_03850 [Mycoplasmoides gallisepticum]|uniref:hypothetical protein n=1 Tax=Mycoplasmoides gallisepticum TaxID=2096 RepID=UPI0039178B10
MKRKDILKFVSLLGIGSFVMLTTASCTSATTPTPNPNLPSGYMNGENTNPGGGQNMMGAAAQELTAAKTALTTLVNGETANLALYEDYVKIKSELTSAYEIARAVSAKTGATLNEVNEAKSSLDAAIKIAASAKNDFDSKNQSLITAYNALKDTVNMETQILESLSAEKYSGIRNSLTNLYDAAKAILKKTLNPIDGVVLAVDDVTMANSNITTATDSAKLGKEMKNADMFDDGFVKKALDSQQLTTATTVTEGDTQAVPQQQQPGNYSFVGYSVDITSGSNDMMLPNWNFAKRIVWTNTGGNNLPLAYESQNSVPLTDVSWIYSLSGANAKYTLTFDYYGASSNGYLYFPYKLVKSGEKAGLQYSLNGASAKEIQFKTATETQPVQEGASATHRDSSSGIDSTSASSSAAAAPGQTSPGTAETPASPSATSQGSVSTDQTMPTATTMNKAPTVDSINVAKITLTDLNLGQNTIEFSVPTGDSTKVAPMIGNMYLSSNPNNFDKVYNDIFGNSVAENNAVTVDLLKGYGLAASYREYIRAFTYLNKETQVSENATMKSPTVYLIGLIGGSGTRSDAATVPQTVMTPNVNGDKRTFIIYVNAPEAGNYSISGSYLTKDNRDLRFSTSDNNAVAINLKGKNNWTTLATFDTANNTNIMNGTAGAQAAMQTANKTIRLMKGLNKVIIGGTNNNDTPYIGNLVFTLSTSMPASNSNTASEAETSGSPSSNGVQVAA